MTATRREKKQNKKHRQHPWTASHYHTQTCTNTLLQVPCTSKTRRVTPHMDLNVGGRKTEEEEEEEEGGVTGLILQPLWWRPEEWSWDKARPLTPRPRNGKEMRKNLVRWRSKRISPAERYNSSSSSCTGKKKTEREKRGGNRGEKQRSCAVMYD